MRTFILYCVMFLAFESCKKDKTSSTASYQLPAASQSGANTFGFLLNGEVFIPKGYINPSPNLRVFVDPTFNDGNLDIRVYRIVDKILVDMSIGSDSIKNVGTYPIKDFTRASVYLAKHTKDLATEYCQVYNGVAYNRNGSISITRYDLINRIVSGTFEVTMVNDACGFGTPINITQGRFDLKY